MVFCLASEFEYPEVAPGICCGSSEKIDECVSRNVVGARTRDEHSIWIEDSHGSQVYLFVCPQGLAETAARLGKGRGIEYDQIKAFFGFIQSGEDIEDIRLVECAVVELVRLRVR